MSGNYLNRIMKCQKTNPMIGLHHCFVVHDDWCPHLNAKGTCTCNPDIKLNINNKKYRITKKGQLKADN